MSDNNLDITYVPNDVTKEILTESQAAALLSCAQSTVKESGGHRIFCLKSTGCKWAGFCYRFATSGRLNPELTGHRMLQAIGVRYHTAQLVRAPRHARGVLVKLPGFPAEAPTSTPSTARDHSARQVHGVDFLA